MLRPLLLAIKSTWNFCNRYFFPLFFQFVLHFHEQQGAERAKYGEATLLDLAVVLTNEFGRGFSLTNLKLKRQFNSGLYERPALSRDKDGIRKLAAEGQIINRPEDLRTSERRFYQKITDIYATSIDYDPTLSFTRNKECCDLKVRAAGALRGRLEGGAGLWLLREPFVPHFQGDSSPVYDPVLSGAR